MNSHRAANRGVHEILTLETLDLASGSTGTVVGKAVPRRLVYGLDPDERLHERVAAEPPKICEVKHV